MFQKEGDKLPFLRELEEKGRKIREEDVEPPISEAGLRLIGVFLDVCNWRGSTGMGPEKLLGSTFDDYTRHTGAVLSSFEVSVMKKLDTIYLNAIHGSQNDGS